MLCKRDFYSRRSVWSAKPGPEAATSHPLQTHAAAGLSKSLGSATGRRVSLLGCPARFCPQGLEEKTMTKIHSGVCGVTRGLLSLDTQKFIGEDGRQGNSSAVTMHWRVTLAPGAQGGLVPSRVAVNTPCAHEKWTRIVLEFYIHII